MKDKLEAILNRTASLVSNHEVERIIEVQNEIIEGLVESLEGYANEFAGEHNAQNALFVAKSKLDELIGES